MMTIRFNFASLAIFAWVLVAVTGCSEGGPQTDFDELDDNRGLTAGRLVVTRTFIGDELDREQWRHDGPESDWKVRGGLLESHGSSNRPIWLNERLPEYARVELTVSTPEPGSEFRFELFGDGRNNESGYIAVFGAYGNLAHVLARFDEHGDDRQLVSTSEITEADRSYDMTFVRTDAELRWFVDGELLLSFVDDDYLAGDGHDYFGINSWRSPVAVEKLSLYAVED